MENSLPLWIVEDCTWPVLWGVLLISLFGFAWLFSRQILALIAAVAVVGLVALTVYLELTVVTDKEYVVEAVYKMAAAVRNNDPQGIVQFVDVENKVFAHRIKQEMDRYDFRNCQVSGFSSIEVGDAGTEPRLARVQFSVWVMANYKDRLDSLQSAMVTVELEFAKKNGSWVVQAYGYKPSNVPGKINLTRR